MSLLKTKLTLVTGKGGVGKSFHSAKSSVMAAQEGKNVLLIECNPMSQLLAYFRTPSPLFDFKLDLDKAKTKASDHDFYASVYRCPNTAGSVDLLRAEFHYYLKEYIVKYLGKKWLYESLFNNSLASSLFNTIPGLGEIMLLGRLYYSAHIEKKYDHVVFDGFASGHFYQMITTPLAIRESRLGGPLEKEAEKILDFMEDGTHNCQVILVTRPESLALTEWEEFHEKLQQIKHTPIGAVIVNQSSPLVTATHPISIQSIESTCEKLSRRSLQPQPWDLWSQEDLGFIEQPLFPKDTRTLESPLGGWRHLRSFPASDIESPQEFQS